MRWSPARTSSRRTIRGRKTALSARLGNSLVSWGRDESSERQTNYTSQRSAWSSFSSDAEFRCSKKTRRFIRDPLSASGTKRRFAIVSSDCVGCQRSSSPVTMQLLARISTASSQTGVGARSGILWLHCRRGDWPANHNDHSKRSTPGAAREDAQIRMGLPIIGFVRSFEISAAG
jgi:hypothetical protein